MLRFLVLIKRFFDTPVSPTFTILIFNDIGYLSVLYWPQVVCLQRARNRAKRKLCIFTERAEHVYIHALNNSCLIWKLVFAFITVLVRLMYYPLRGSSDCSALKSYRKRTRETNQYILLVGTQVTYNTGNGGPRNSAGRNSCETNRPRYRDDSFLNSIAFIFVVNIVCWINYGARRKSVKNR